MDENIVIEDFSDYNLIRKFLLHQLDPVSREEVEERFFHEPQFKEWVLLIEEEIMEDYLLERLSSDDRLRVQKYLLSSPQQIQKLYSIKEIVQTVNHLSPDESLKTETSKKGIFQTIRDFYTASSKPLVFGSSLILIISFSLVISFLSERSPSLNEALLKKIETFNREKDSPENASSSVFELSRVSARGNTQNNRVFIKPGDRIVEFRLAIDQNQYQSYQATFNKFNSPPITTVKSLQLSQKDGATYLRIKFPVEVFEKGFYQINVSGIADGNVEELGTYGFEVFE
jgi:hypothetical protein